MRIFIIVFAVCAVALLSCSGTQPSVNIDEENHAPDRTNSQWNEEFDPMTLGDYKMEIDTKKMTDDILDIDQLLRAEKAREGTKERSQIQGYRVQLISTRNEEEARAVMRNAVISFAEPTYREYDNPYYKIRVGDFKSRYEAGKTQEQAIEMGFHEAWVVRAMIWDGPAQGETTGAEEF